MRTIKHPERFERKLTKEQQQGLMALHGLFQFPHLRVNYLKAIRYEWTKTHHGVHHNHRPAGSKLLKRTDRLMWEKRFRPTENERLDGVH
jgi:hypothetical protein